MAEITLPNLIIDKNDPNDGIKELLMHIQPQWDQTNICIKEMSGGYSGKIFCCFNGNDTDNAVTVRIRNLADEIKQWQNDLEPKVIGHLSKLGHFSRFYATFANGYCYHFIKGTPMANVKLKTGYVDDKMLISIAKEMVFLHSIKMPDVEYSGNGFLDMLGMFLDSSTLSEEERFLKKSVLMTEISFLIELFKPINSPHAICHGDPHPGNYVWNSDTEKVTFVDWEGAHVGYQFQDVAHFLVSMEMFTNGVIPGMEAIKMPLELENTFLSAYFEEWCKQKDEMVTEESLLEFKEKIEKFKLSPLICNVVFAMIVPHIFDELTGNVKKFSEMLWKRYIDIKEKVCEKDQFESLN